MRISQVTSKVHEPCHSMRAPGGVYMYRLNLPSNLESGGGYGTFATERERERERREKRERLN